MSILSLQNRSAFVLNSARVRNQFLTSRMLRKHSNDSGNASNGNRFSANKGGSGHGRLATKQTKVFERSPSKRVFERLLSATCAYRALASAVAKVSGGQEEPLEPHNGEHRRASRLLTFCFIVWNCRRCYFDSIRGRVAPLRIQRKAADKP